MGKLSKKEKEELLQLSASFELRKDFANIRNNRAAYFASRGANNIDSFIEFLNFSNAFINHRGKIFKKISGRKFKI